MAKQKKTNQSVISHYLKDIPEIKFTKKDHLYYGKLYQTGTPAEKKLAEEKLVSSCLFVVVNVAKNINHSSMDLEDLIQEGNIGLLHAVEKYDYKKGFAFTTYATWWIRQSILKGIKDKSSNVRLPNHVYDLQRKITHQEKELYDQGEEISDKKIAVGLGLKEDKVKSNKTHFQVLFTKDIDEIEKSETNNSERNPKLKYKKDVFDEVFSEQVSELINHLLNKSNLLSKREADVLCLRYGLIHRIPADRKKKYEEGIKIFEKNSDRKIKTYFTFKEVSTFVVVTMERVRQVEGTALITLRDYRELNKKLFENLL